MLAYLKKTYGGTRADFFRQAAAALAEGRKLFIITANPETFMIARGNPKFHDAIMQPSTTVVPDGIGVVKAMSMVRLPITERVPGVELSQYLLEEAARLHKKVCLFGAKPEILDALVKKYEQEYPELNICGSFHGYLSDRNEVFDRIAALEPDLVLVALGVPEQEILISERLKDFTKGVFIGVGGTFDVLSGMKKRAPKFFLKFNLEWLYRITREPKRLKRFFDSNVKFFFVIRKEYREEKQRIS